MVTVDAVVLAGPRDDIEVLLVRRRNEPFAGMLALPGGFVDMDEDLADAAARELEEETGLTGVPLEQLGAFGRPGRDPRGRNICIAFVGALEEKKTHVKGGDDAVEAVWVRAADPTPLAFDHAEILTFALRWLGSRS
jgi:8-oxo-dGTP diphosphatase